MKKTIFFIILAFTFTTLMSCTQATEPEVITSKANKTQTDTPVATSQGVQPSFDCKKANHVVETLICSSSTLSALDVALAQSFRVMLNNLQNDAKQALKKQQRDWLKFRNQSCVLGEKNCEKIIAARVEKLGGKHLIEELMSNHIIKRKIHESLPVMTFLLNIKKPKNIVESIDIHFHELNKKVQTIAINAEFSDGYIDFIDANFDGYLDFRTPQFRTAGPNTPYLFYLYQPEAQKFVFSPKISDIVSAQFDAEKKAISSFTRNHAASYTKKIYSVKNDAPQLNYHEARECETQGKEVVCSATRYDLQGKVLKRKNITSAQLNDFER
ncbi:MAG: lysozyme inhibitor LprI family protein [Pseudomonadota bacterium]